MFYMGVDYHKKYSHIEIQDEKGSVIVNQRITNDRAAFESVKRKLQEPCEAVIEAGRTWGVIYDVLEEAGFDVTVAHPLKVRAIAEAKIKTDSIDAGTLADLLRADLIPEVHVPSNDTRLIKNLLRERLWLVRLQTMIKNRIILILDRNHVKTPGVTDLFGSIGRHFLREVCLPAESEQRILNSQLDCLVFVQAQIVEATKWVKESLAQDRRMEIIDTLPGFGLILSALIALEIDDVNRFAHPGKLASYIGLIPSTRSSGGRTYHGALTGGNRHLRYAFIEGAWNAIRRSPYCRAMYERIKERKAPSQAIVAVARRLSEIAFDCLKNNRPYEERPYAPVLG
jgi:transposase